MMFKKLTAVIGALTALAGMACNDGDDGNTPLPRPSLSVWVADQPKKQVVIVDDAGKLIRTVGEFPFFSKPNAFEIQPTSGDVWICDYYTNRLYRSDADGNVVYMTPAKPGNWFLRATGISLNLNTDECWVADRSHDRIVRLKPDLTIAAVVTGLHYPRSVAVTRDGSAVWTADEGSDSVIRVIGSVQGELGVEEVTACRYTRLTKPWVVSAAADGGAWVASQEEGKVVRLSLYGQELAAVEGFNKPTDIAVHPTAGYVVVADATLGKVVALPSSLSGHHPSYSSVAVFTYSTGGDPEDIYVEPKTGEIFIADMTLNMVYVLNSEGEEVNAIGPFEGPAAVAVWKKTE